MENKTTEANVPPIVTEEEVKVLPPQEEDLEAKIKALEDEKAQLIENEANYKVAYLKEKSRNRENPEDESEDDKIRRIAKETLAESRIAQINLEQDALIKRTLKENKELKLAQLNKTTATPPAGMGTSSEGQPVRDTLITPEQMAAFKAKGWSEKDIERYKKNLVKYSGR